MTCRDAKRFMDDFVDNRLAEPETQRVQDHLEGCIECRRAEGRLRCLINEARNLPHEIAPSSQTWEAIRRRMEQPVQPSPRRRRMRHRFAWNAAGFLLVAAAMSFTLWLTHHKVPPNQAGVGAEPSQIEHALADYVRARDILLAELDKNKLGLPPETLATVQENLAIADEAISDVSLALRQQPDSRHLREMLFFAYECELALLMHVIDVLPSV